MMVLLLRRLCNACRNISQAVKGKQPLHEFSYRTESITGYMPVECHLKGQDENIFFNVQISNSVCGFCLVKFGKVHSFQN